MASSVKTVPTGFCVNYPKTNWQVNFVEDAQGKFRFYLTGQKVRFEPRDRYRYPNYDDARRAAFCFLELMKRLERSRMRLNILSEIGILKFPQQTYHGYELWLLVDRTRYTWEARLDNGFCVRSQRWYKRHNTALLKAKGHIDREIALGQIRDIVGWV